ncbi:PAS domain S-box protein [Skermanella rosea]|uniref:sensor histidine kinase n=1 Tax=Skermanella rosea TaxID=1817965 RepID=UPI0019328565|nr:PAS domain-containing protein [Skermanella rosea]UEM01166.1 PAS domain S-box protein [Skermanella rosea]
METVPVGPLGCTVRRAALHGVLILCVSVGATLGLAALGVLDAFAAALITILTAIATAAMALQFRLRRQMSRAAAPATTAPEPGLPADDIYVSIVAAMPELILISRNGRVDYINGSGIRMVGAASADILLARPVLDLVDGVTSQEIRDRIEAALLVGEQIAPCEIWLARFDGTPVCVEACGVPIGGQLDPLVLLIARDISDQRRAEAALRQAKEQAELANRTRSQFLANMSHELRTPLNAIIGFSEIIADEAFGPTGQPLYTEYARDIRDGGRHLLRVINDILDYSKVEDGKMELYEDIGDIAEILAASIRVVIGRAESADVRVTLEIQENLPHVLVDAMKLKQVLLNLLSNAVKFTARGGSVTVSAAAAPDGGLDIAVADTGIGMTKAEIDMALEPFTQIESSLSRRYEGTGLGLPITNSLVELHGGRLLIASTPGVGTRVTVHLPVSRILRQAAPSLAER